MLDWEGKKTNIRISGVSGGGVGGWGGRRRGRKTVNVPFLIAQLALKVSFWIIQCAPKVPFFKKLLCPFLFLGLTLKYQGQAHYV